jgi:ABC-type nitrate/sulfonate/bicarbonate transport system permease component
MNRSVKVVIGSFITLFSFMLFWELGHRYSGMPFWPGLFNIPMSFIELTTEGDFDGILLSNHTIRSLIRVFAGFIAGAVTGIPLGIAMGMHPRIYKGVRSLLDPMRFIPPVCWVPIASILLMGLSRYIFILWTGAFNTFWLWVMVSVRAVSPLHKDVTTVFGASRWYTIRHVTLPAIIPDVMGAMRLAMGICWMGIVAAEMVGVENVGIGRFIWSMSGLLRMDDMIVGMVVIAIVGIFINESLLRIERLIAPWRFVRT